MEISRIMVRLMADSSHYLAAFSKAENKLQSFGASIAKIQEKYNRAVSTANARHMNAVENAAHRQNQIIRLANRNFEFAARTYDRIHQQSIDRARNRQQRADAQSKSALSKSLDAANDRYLKQQDFIKNRLERADLAHTRRRQNVMERFERFKIMSEVRFANRTLGVNAALEKRRQDALAQGVSKSQARQMGFTPAEQRIFDKAVFARDQSMVGAKAEKAGSLQENNRRLAAVKAAMSRLTKQSNAEFQAAALDAHAKHATSILAAQDQLARSIARADKLKDNASIKSVEARNKAIEQANLRHMNAVRNADFRRDMTLKAAGLQLKDDKAAAIARNKAKALQDSAELRDRLSHDLRIVSYAATAAFGFVAYEAIKLGANFQKAGIELEVMTGNAVVAQQLLKDIQTLAIESPFQTSDLVASAKQVKAFGFETSQIIPILSRLGDVASGTGADMDRVILAFGQVRTTGRLMGQELRQFTNAGIPILEYLAKVMGVTEQQMPNLVRQGKVSFGDVAKAFNMMTDSGGIFNGMMERINKETIHGRWQNLKENLQLAAIQLGLGAFEGLKLSEVLTDIASEVRGLDQGRVAEFFGNMRKGLELVWMTGKRVLEWMKNFLASVGVTADGMKSWYERNERLIATIGLITGYLIAATVAVRTFILVTRILILTLGVLKGVFLAMSVISFVAGAGMSVMGWLISLGPTLGVIVAVTAAVLALGSALGVLNGVGQNWVFGKDFLAGLKVMQSVFPDIVKGLKETFMAGDLAGTLDILWETIKLGWMVTLDAMKKEFRNFLGDFMGDMMAISSGAVPSLVLAKRAALNIPQPFETEENIRAFWDNKIKLAFTASRGMGHALVGGILPGMDNNMPGIEAQRQRLLETVQERRTSSLFQGQTAKNIHQQITGPMQRALLTGDHKAFFETAGRAEAYSNMPPELTQRIGGLQAVMGGMGVPSLGQSYAEKWNAVYNSVSRVTKLAHEGKFGTPEMEEAVKTVNLFSADLDNWSAELQKVQKDMKAAIYPIPSYPEHVTHMIRDLDKEITDGITPMDRYTKSMQALNTAFEGLPIAAENMPFRNSTAAMAALGVPGLQGSGRLLPLIGKEVYDVGAFKEFEKLRSTVHDRRGEGTPAMLFGSREAADTIAKNNAQALTVQEQVLQTMRDAVEVEKGTQDYTRQVAEVLTSMRSSGAANQGGGWSIFQDFRKGP